MKDKIAAFQKWKKDLEKLLAKAQAAQKPGTGKSKEELRDEYEAGEITIKQYEKLIGATVNPALDIYIQIIELQLDKVIDELASIK